jgi:hypothetical protein
MSDGISADQALEDHSMTLRMTFRKTLTVGLPPLIGLGLLFATPARAQLTASPEAALDFKPQEVTTPSSGAVQQDAPALPQMQTPYTPSPYSPYYPYTPSGTAGNSQSDTEIARQVLVNLMNVYANPSSASNPLPLWNNDSVTEGSFSYGGYCPTGTCFKSSRNSGLSGFTIDQLSFGSTGNSCRDRILNAARSMAAGYRNRGSAFQGACAFAVRTALQKAGLNKIGALGDAKDMGPNLKRLGFVNKMTSTDPDRAPEGAILVYGPAQRSGCTGAGSTFGHVEVKDFNGLFHYDGTATHNIQKRFGEACRPLIGVYLPGPELERSC